MHSYWEEERWNSWESISLREVNINWWSKIIQRFLKFIFKNYLYQLHGLYIIGKYFLATPGIPGFEFRVLVCMPSHFSSQSSLKVSGILNWETTQGNQENTSSECHSFIQLTLSTIFDGMYSEFSIPDCPDWISLPQFYKAQPSLLLDDLLSLWDAQKTHLRVLFHVSVLKSSKTCRQM